MDSISKLYIKIDLDGDITGTIDDYDYTVNTSPKSLSGNKSVYITKKYLLNKKHLLESSYKDDLKSIFLNKSTLRDMIVSLPTTVIKNSNNKYSTKAGKDDIIKNNIELIISLFFPKKSFFYVKGVKFVIDNKTVHYKVHPHVADKSNLLTYDDLEDELLDKLESKEHEKLKKKQDKYKKYLLKLSSADQGLFKKEHKLLNYTDSQLENKARTNTLSILIGTMGSKLINNYGEKKVNELNDKLKKKGKRSLYKYVNDKGIRLIEDKSTGIHCTVTLYLLDSKTPTHSRLKHTCKTRKQKIKSIYNEILTGKKSQITSTKSIPKYTVDTLSEPLFSSDDSHAMGHKSLNSTKKQRNKVNKVNKINNFKI